MRWPEVTPGDLWREWTKFDGWSGRSLHASLNTGFRGERVTRHGTCVKENSNPGRFRTSGEMMDRSESRWKTSQTDGKDGTRLVTAPT